MGGRGAYWNGDSANYDRRQFDTIDKVGNIKVIKPREGVKNVTFPLYSNTKNTTYFVADKNNGEEIKSIGFYRDHKLVKSIDITSKGEHVHYWKDGTKTQKDGTTTPTRIKMKGEHPVTTDRERRLIKEAKAWKKDGIA